MRTALRWFAGLFVVYLLLTGVWRLAVAVGLRDWSAVVGSVFGLMFILWLFDTFRPSGPTALRRRRSTVDASA